MFNRIGCCVRKKRSIQVSIPDSPVTMGVEAENTVMTQQKSDNVELGVVEKQIPAYTVRHERPSTAFSIIQVDRVQEGYQETWKEIARALDRIFFWLFLALFVISSIAIYSQAGRLSSFDSLDD